MFKRATAAQLKKPDEDYSEKAYRRWFNFQALKDTASRLLGLSATSEDPTPKIDGDVTIEEFLAAKSWLDEQTLRPGFGYVDFINFPEKRTVYQRFQVAWALAAFGNLFKPSKGPLAVKHTYHITDEQIAIDHGVIIVPYESNGPRQEQVLAIAYRTGQVIFQGHPLWVKVEVAKRKMPIVFEYPAIDRETVEKARGKQ
jgi:hypothetical protein